MLEATTSFERRALNRVTFGARDVDVALVKQVGWTAWVDAQLNPPAGDDPDLDRYLRSQIVHIEYEAYDDDLQNYHWKALSEERPLTYLFGSLDFIWKTTRKIPWTVSFAENTRMEMERNAGIYVRNAHSQFQLREFMADFWLNHFSIGKGKGPAVANPLIVYDRDIVRPNVFGNFRTLLEAVCCSTSMMIYLDNATSNAGIPNENYARELMELHTMGRAAYFGKNIGGHDVSAEGFTDDDILQASRALSGWTVQYGQTGAYLDTVPGGIITFPEDGTFVYDRNAHNPNAGRCLGFDLSTLSGQAQGRKILDLVANHPATAPFICGKICRRIFGDNPPAAVIDRAVAAWNANRDRSDHIARVLRAILVDGLEIGVEPAVKVRRPYERFIALARATDSILQVPGYWMYLFYDLHDSPYIWPTPDGRPDSNAFWLSTYANVTTWEYMKRIGDPQCAKLSLLQQTPLSAWDSPIALVEYWVGRIVGYALNDAAMGALAAIAAEVGPPPKDAATNPAAGANWEMYFAERVIATIAAAPEFVLR